MSPGGLALIYWEIRWRTYAGRVVEPAYPAILPMRFPLLKSSAPGSALS